MQLGVDSSMILIAGHCALAYLGIKFFLALAALVWKRLLAPCVDLNKKYAGHWALVTGSTDGIGKAYAFALAKCNLNIILVSRTQSKLDTVADEIAAKYPKVKTKTISVDFVNDEETSYRLKIAREIEGNHTCFNKSMIVSKSAVGRLLGPILLRSNSKPLINIRIRVND